MRKPMFMFILAILFVRSSQASELIEFAESPEADFAPARGEKFSLPIRVKTPVEVKVSILTSDGDLVRTLKSQGIITSGEHKII